MKRSGNGSLGYSTFDPASREFGYVRSDALKKKKKKKKAKQARPPQILNRRMRPTDEELIEKVAARLKNKDAVLIECVLKLKIPRRKVLEVLSRDR